MKPIVSIVRDVNVDSAVKQALDAIRVPDLTGKRVLLKPNVGRQVEPYIGVNTNPKVVEAVFHYLKERHDAEFFIGDSPIISTNTRDAFKQSGYDYLLNSGDLEFVDLDSLDPIEREIPDGLILKNIKLSGFLDEIDYIVSIPVLKMHMHTGASISFKNMKGVIYKREKIKLHHLSAPDIIDSLKPRVNKVKELDVAISDLERVIRPDLAVIDATNALEGMGPASGNPVKLDMIIASNDFLAADVVALHLTRPDWNLDNVPHLKLIAMHRKKPGPFSINDVRTVPENLSTFQHSIEPPPASISIKYKNVKVFDIESCSACLSTVFSFIKNNKEFIDENFTPEQPLALGIGKGLKNVDLYTPTFLIGNCTANRKEDGVFIQGCTPVQSTILKTIKEYLSNKEKS
ncbi:MAG: DUF362 domain-containing protein [Promethearchaeota archaeon]